MLQPLDEALIHKGVEEGHLLGALLHDGTDDVLDHGLRHIHVALQVTEGHLRLDHPELSSVALGVGVLRPESGAEGIHIAESHGKVLGVELAGHREVGVLAEEVLAEIHSTVLSLGDIVQIHSGHLEHLTGALTVAGGDDGGMDVDEATVLEEGVDRMGRHAAHPEHCGEQVGAGPQMGDGPQVLHTVALLLKGIIGGGSAFHRNGSCLHLQRLLGLGGQHQGTGDDQGRAHVLSGDLLIIIQHIGVHHHLEVPETGTVVELDEPKGLHVPNGAGPAAHCHRLAAQLLAVGVDGRDFDPFHMSSPTFSIVLGCNNPE